MKPCSVVGAELQHATGDFEDLKDGNGSSESFRDYLAASEKIVSVGHLHLRALVNWEP